MTWSERWEQLLTDLGYEPHLRRGRSYARRGRVKGMEVQVGRITAQVEDRDQGPCDVEIEVNRFTDTEWSQVMDALSGEAIHVAQLLAGDMPANIEDLFAAAGVSLLPRGQYDIQIHCSGCRDWEQPCKHTAAVLYLLGQMFDDSPWLLFRLRGRDRQQVLQALRQRRTDIEESSPPAVQPTDMSGPPALGNLRAEQSMPLSAQMESYWGSSKKMMDLHHHVAAPAIKLALLRRLGRPPFPTESIEVYEHLTRIYQIVSEKALDLAYAPEPEEEDV